MFCNSCGAELKPSLKFCENCGAPAQTASTQEMPAQSAPIASQPDGPEPPASMQQPTYQPSMPQMPPQNMAPGTAFALAIVGLVLSCLFVTFLPGLVCSIIALALNAGYNKKGLANRHKTSTTVLGVIGIVIAVLSAVLALFVGVITAQVVQEAQNQGIDIARDSVSVTTDSSGHVNTTVGDSSKSAASSATASAASSASASSTASSREFTDSKFHDSNWNPTLYSALELSGADMRNLLESYNFHWYGGASAYIANDGSAFFVTGASGNLDESQLDALPVGAAGQPVFTIMLIEGYNKPADAFSAVSKDVVVEDAKDAGDVYFALVHSSVGVEYLVAVSEADEGEQSVMVFTDESVSSGLFASATGSNVGSSIKEAWEIVKSI